MSNRRTLLAPMIDTLKQNVWDYEKDAYFDASMALLGQKLVSANRNQALQLNVASHVTNFNQSQYSFYFQ